MPITNTPSRPARLPPPGPGELVAHGLGRLKFVGAEHAESQHDEQQGDGPDHVGALHEGGDSAEDQGAESADDGVDQGHAQGVGHRQAEPAQGALLLALGADHRQRDGDHGVDARRQAHQQAEAEHDHQEHGQPALFDEVGDAVGRPAFTVVDPDRVRPGDGLGLVALGHVHCHGDLVFARLGIDRYGRGPFEDRLAAEAAADRLTHGTEGIGLAEHVVGRRDRHGDAVFVEGRFVGGANGHHQDEVLADLGDLATSSRK